MAGLLGVVLVSLGSIPLGSLLDEGRTGPAGAATRAALDGVAPALGTGTLTIAVVAVLFALLPSTARWVDRLEGGVRRVLGAGSDRGWIGMCGGLALLGALGAQTFLLAGEPTLVDEMAQLADARALAGLQPETTADVSAVRIQNGTIVEGRWVSIYPPGHTLLVAGAMRVGLLGWVGPLLWGLTVALSALLFLRLLGGGSRTARAAALLTAIAPMGWLLGAGWLSHLGAVCAAVLASVCAERGWRAVEDGSGGVALAWGAGLGAAAGWAVTSRPLTGLVLAVVLPAAVLAWAGGRRVAPVLGGAVAGGLPFAIGLGAWNAKLFGSPLTFGYSAAFGPAHGLGLHVDPWGNAYGLVEAVAYTAADLLLVGPAMFGVPLPLAALVGVGIWAVRSRRPGLGAGLAWIGGLLAANALYWHHGLHFGPRMLFETLPAWSLVLAILFSDGVRTVGGRGRSLLWSGVVAALVVAGGIHLPGLFEAAKVGDARRAQLPDAEAVAALPDSAVVAVVGSWNSRVAARLAAAGVRADSIETALRRNGICRVHDATDALRSGLATLTSLTPADSARVRVAALGVLDFDPQPGSPPELGRVDLAPGVSVRQAAGRPWSESCLGEARADAAGAVLELEALRWRVERSDVSWLRSMGARADAEGGATWMIVRGSDGRPTIVPIAEGHNESGAGAPEGQRRVGTRSV